MSSPNPNPVDTPNKDDEIHCDEAVKESQPSAKSPTSSDDFTPKKPYISYNALIIMALKNSPEKKLLLRGIYEYIKDNFPFYRTTTIDWKNSIRHNLSVNNWFVKVKLCPYNKGACYWMLDESYGDEMYLDSMERRRVSRAKGRRARALTTPPEPTMPHGGVAPAMYPEYFPPTPMPPYAPNSFYGVGAPTMLQPFLPTPMSPYPPNSFYGVGAPVLFMPTPMIMQPPNIDHQVYNQMLRAEQQLQQQIGTWALFPRMG